MWTMNHSVYVMLSFNMTRLLGEPLIRVVLFTCHLTHAMIYAEFKTTGNSEINKLRLGKIWFERSSNSEFQLWNSGLFLRALTFRPEDRWRHDLTSYFSVASGFVLRLTCFVTMTPWSSLSSSHDTVPWWAFMIHVRLVGFNETAH